jgi:uncharacterized spore protein YtfJ
MTTIEKATDGARKAALGGPADRLLERLAELVGGRAGVTAVFGEPIRQGELVVVPVARIRWGFGGGGGRAEDAPSGTASGSGGGGGAAGDPVGYIEISGDEAIFRQIHAPYPSVGFLLASGVTAAIVIRAFARLIRG